MIAIPALPLAVDKAYIVSSLELRDAKKDRGLVEVAKLLFTIDLKPPFLRTPTTAREHAACALELRILPDTVPILRLDMDHALRIIC